MNWKTIIISVAVAACLLLALLGGVLFSSWLSRPSPNVTPELALAPTTAPAEVVRPAPELAPAVDVWPALQQVSTSIDKATTFMQKASTGKKGGFVEKARDDLVKVKEDLDRLQKFALEHPEAVARAPVPGDPFDKAVPAVARMTAGPQNAAPNLRKALVEVQAAYDALRQIPGDEARQTLLLDLALTATDLACGIEIAANGGAAPPTPRPRPDTPATRPILP